jgi:class 3 adenylate cyclase/tetratricopeptide (TPR) repeat protein
MLEHEPDPHLDVDMLASFVPDMLTRRMAVNPDVLSEPTVELLSAVLLECDLSGFTAFTESLARKGPAGAEEVSRTLSHIFAGLGEVVANHGGDVVQFAGDALLAMWIVPTPDESPITVRHAAQCAFDLQDLFEKDSVARTHSLSMRAGIGVGDVSAYFLGGVGGRWDLALAGSALTQVGAAQAAAALGGVSISAEAANLFFGERSDETARTFPIAIGRDDLDELDRLPSGRVDLTSAAENSLRSYIPSAVISHLAADQSGYMAELRRISVLFVDLPELTSGTFINRAQDIVVALQETLQHFEGTFHKLSVDDKGVKLIGVFGLPPLSHEDDPVRAVLAAREMARLLQEINVQTSIGVTTGRAFCGVLGGERRREYTVIGDMVNLSARLMQAAQGGILCDDETYRACQLRVAFRASRPIAIKGKAEPVVAYSPTGEHPEEVESGSARSVNSTQMVGRAGESHALNQTLESLGGGEGEVTVLVGEAGIGKSRLIEYLLNQARPIGVQTLVGAGDAIEATSPYRAWRPILRQLLGLQKLPADREIQRNHVISVLSEIGDLSGISPVINAILPLDFPESELTQAMSGDVRADNIQAIVTALVQAAAEKGPLLLVFDDAQWLDPSSWQLARDVFTSVRPLGSVIATRPPGEPPPTEYQAFIRATSPQILELGPMSADDINTLVCNTLGIERLAREVMDLLHDKAEGHPMFSKELAYYLRNEGLVVTSPPLRPGALPEGVLAPDADLSDVAFPDTVQVVITSRIDRLDVRQQLILKVASVIGRVFPIDVLLAVLPVETTDERFAADVAHLVDADLIEADSDHSGSTYGFRHGIIQEVAYGLLPFADRSNLHRAIGEWYERTHVDDLDPYLTVLAHHWTAANDETRSIRYQALAGEQALANFANEEAITYLGRTLELCENATIDIDSRDLASWELHMGAAQIHWSRYAEGRHHLQEGLALLDHPVPLSTSKVARSGHLTKAMFVQWRNRLFGTGKPVVEIGKRNTLLTASRAYTRLVEAAFLSGDEWLALYSSFHALNLAEKSDPSPELAEAYGPVGVIYGAIPLRKEAKRYLDRAVETAREIDSPSALGYTLLAHGAYSVGAADWSTAATMSEDLIELGSRYGARKRLSDGLQLKTSLSYLQGQFEACSVASDELLASASRGRDPRFSAYGNFAKAYAALYLGRPEEALTSLEQIPVLLGEQSATTDRMLDLMYLALLAVTYLRLGRDGDAMAAALDALARQAGAPLDLGFAVPGYALTADVLLSLWEAGHPDPRLHQSAKHATKSLKKFSRLYGVARPYSTHALGTHMALLGKTRKASRLWRASIASADEVGMPFVAGVSHLKLAGSLTTDNPERGEHAAEARRIFSDLDTPLELALAEELVKGTA